MIAIACSRKAAIGLDITRTERQRGQLSLSYCFPQRRQLPQYPHNYIHRSREIPCSVSVLQTCIYLLYIVKLLGIQKLQMNTVSFQDLTKLHFLRVINSGNGICILEI